jgi:CBS domain-containing protein
MQNKIVCAHSSGKKLGYHTPCLINQVSIALQSLCLNKISSDCIPVKDSRVRDYMTSHVISINLDKTFLDAINNMASNGIGTLVVVDGQTVTGVITEREILYYLVEHEGMPNKSIRFATNKKFVKVSPETEISDAARAMVSRNNRLLVFLEDKLAGIITASDMIDAFLKTRRNPQLRHIMSRRVVTMHPDTSILDAVKTMLKKRIGSVIVSADGGPTSIFTERDLLTKVLSRKVDLHERIGNYSSFPLITAKTGIGVKDAVLLMSSNKIKRLPLTMRGKVVAIVTARDLVSALQRRRKR